MKRIVNIVLTGGPCGGKNKSIKALRVFLANLGYKVIVIPEIATETIMDWIGYTNLDKKDKDML